MFSNSLPIIEIHNTGHALQNKTNFTGWYCFAKNRQNNNRNTRGQNWPQTFLGDVLFCDFDFVSFIWLNIFACKHVIGNQIN